MLPADHGHGTERIVGKSIGKKSGLPAHDAAVLEEEVLGESRGLLGDILRTKRASARSGLIHQRLEILLGKVLQAHRQDARYMAGDGAGSNFSGLLDNLEIFERAFKFRSKNTFCDLNFHLFSPTENLSYEQKIIPPIFHFKPYHHGAGQGNGRKKTAGARAEMSY